MDKLVKIKFDVKMFKQADLPLTILALSNVFVAEIFKSGEGDFLLEKNVLLGFSKVKDFSHISLKNQQEVAKRLAGSFLEYILLDKKVNDKLEQLLQVFAEWAKLCFVKENATCCNLEAKVLFDRLLLAEEYVVNNMVTQGYYGDLPISVSKKYTARELARLSVLSAKACWQAQKDLFLAGAMVLDCKYQEKCEKSYASIYQTKLKELSEQKLYQAISKLESDLSVNAWQLAKAYVLKDAKRFSSEELRFVDVVAEVYDFSSGSELAEKVLQSLPLFLQAKAETTELLRAKYDGVYCDVAKIKAKAQEVMYNANGAKLVASEGQLIAKQAKQLVKAESLYKKEKSRAKADIGDMVIAEAIDVKRYIAAERMAFEKSLVAWAEGKLEKAYEQKQIQLYNYFMVQESLAVKERYQKLHEYLVKESLLGKKTWLDVRNFCQVGDILTRFGYMAVDYVETEKTESLLAYVGRQEVENPAIVKIAAWLESDLAIYQVTKKLTVSEFADVVHAIENIKKLDSIGLNSDRLLVVAKSKSQLVKQLEASKGKVDEAVSENILLGLEDIRSLLAPLGRVWQETFWQNVQNAANKKGKMLKKVCSEIDKAFTVRGLTKELRATEASEKVFIKEWQTSFTKAELRVIALNLGSKENVFCLLKDLAKRIGQGDLSEEQIKSVLANYLTKEDFVLVGRIWQVLSLPLEYVAMCKLMQGYSKEKQAVSEVDFILEDGSYFSVKGGYYFLQPDIYLALDKEKRLKDYLGVLPYENVLIDDVNKENWLLEWDFNEVFGHLERLVNDIAFRPVLHDLDKLLQEENVKNTLLARTGEKGLLALSRWLKSMARDDKAAEFAIWAKVAQELLASKILTNATLFTKMTVLPKNMDMAVFKQVVGNCWTDKQKAIELVDFVSSKSKIINERIKKLSLAIKESFFVLDGKFVSTKEQGVLLVEWARLIVQLPLWVAIYQGALAQGKVDSQALVLADKNSDLPLVVAEQEVAICLTMFMEFFHKQVAIWQEENDFSLGAKELSLLALVMVKQYVLVGVLEVLNRSVELPEDFVEQLSGWNKELLFARSYATKVGLQSVLGFIDEFKAGDVQVSSLQFKEKEKASRWFFSAYYENI